MPVELKDLTALLEKMKNDIKSEIELTIRKEINSINIQAILEEQNRKYNELKKENMELKQIVVRQNMAFELMQRRNNLIVFGIPETNGENPESLQHSILDLFNKALEIEMNKNDLNFVKRIGPAENKKRPIVVSCISNIKKRSLLLNAK